MARLPSGEAIIRVEPTINLSVLEKQDTASTTRYCAQQRAARLSSLNRVLELCVGPSYEVLRQAYLNHEVFCSANDIDPRWETSTGEWFIGDCFKTFELYHDKFDGIVFAPPLSKGCSGRREDSLMVLEVQPSFLDFSRLIIKNQYRGKVTLVLPGRSFATKQDRSQFWHLRRILGQNFDIGVFPLVQGCSKYIDMEIQLRLE